MLSSYTTQFTQLPPPPCLCDSDSVADFMGGISKDAVGNNPTQAEDRQDDLVLLGFFLLAILADLNCGMTLNFIPSMYEK